MYGTLWAFQSQIVLLSARLQPLIYLGSEIVLSLGSIQSVDDIVLKPLFVQILMHLCRLSVDGGMLAKESPGDIKKPNTPMKKRPQIVGWLSVGYDE